MVRLKKDVAAWLLRISEPYAKDLIIGHLVVRLRRPVFSVNREVAINKYYVATAVTELLKHNQSPTLVAFKDSL